jgi:CBS domain containing-hemolysin-like protein
VTVFSVVLTLAILFLSEIIPKTIGAVYWRGLAGPIATMLDWTVKILRFTGLIQLSNLLSKMISGGKKEGAVSREELVAMADLGVEEGVFGEQESRILASLFRFNELRTRDVMTPRTVLLAFREDTPIRAVAEADVRFSRLPIYSKSLDQVTGVVLKDEVLLAAAEGRGAEPLSTLQRDIMTVPDSLPLPQLFERFLDRREHLALVVGEYGGTSGVATMEDVVETLLGLEIVDEYDHETDMQHAAREQWEQRAKKLGLLSPDATAADVDADTLPSPAEEQRAAARHGITGGEPGPADRK